MSIKSPLSSEFKKNYENDAGSRILNAKREEIEKKIKGLSD